MPLAAFCSGSRDRPRRAILARPIVSQLSPPMMSPRRRHHPPRLPDSRRQPLGEATQDPPQALFSNALDGLPHADPFSLADVVLAPAIQLAGDAHEEDLHDARFARLHVFVGAERPTPD